MLDKFLHQFTFKMETEAAARSHTRKRVPEAYSKYVEEKRRAAHPPAAGTRKVYA